MPAFATIYPAPPTTGPLWLIFDGADMWTLGNSNLVKFDLTGNVLGNFTTLGLVGATSMGFDGTHLWIANFPVTTDIVLVNLDGSLFTTYDQIPLGIFGSGQGLPAFAFDG